MKDINPLQKYIKINFVKIFGKILYATHFHTYILFLHP